MSSSEISSFGREAGRVAAQVTHWTPARWRMSSCDDPAVTRAGALHTAIQRLADLTARVEGRSARHVPRPVHDGVLPDQWRVIVNDFGAARPAASDMDLAWGVLADVRHALFTATSLPRALS